VGYWALSKLAAFVHLVFIAFLVAGGPAGRRWPRLVPAHAAAVAATVAVNLSHRPCPLTVAEKELARRAGRTPYDGGFVSHYLVEPIRPSGIDGRVDLVLVGAWIVPTSLAYLAMGRRRARG